MPRITKVYTRTGDDGTTGLGGGQRVRKDSPRIEAYGTVDELNSSIGVALAAGLTPALDERLRGIQNELFHLGSDLCILEADKARLSVPRIEERHVAALEKTMDALTDQLPALENFVLPGGAPGAAALHVARTVCRRAERRIVALDPPVDPVLLRYVNRLSDLLFVLARVANHRAGVPEIEW